MEEMIGMLSIRKILCPCLIMLCIMIPSFMSNSVSAEMITGPVSTINALTTNIIQIHPSFAEKITGAKNNTNISPDTLSTATNLESNIFTLANQWKNILGPNLQWRKDQIISYNNDKFYQKFNVIKDQINVQKTQAVPTAQFILIDLGHMQSDLAELKNGVTEALEQIRGFKQDFAQNSQQLQTVNTRVKASSDGYVAVVDTLNEQLNTTSSGSAKQEINNQISATNQKLTYSQTLYFHINTIIGNINGNDGSFVTLSLLDSLEDLNTNWTVLDSKLNSIIQNLEDAKDIDWNFILSDLEIVRSSWDAIYNKAQQL